MNAVMKETFHKFDMLVELTLVHSRAYLNCGQGREAVVGIGCYCHTVHRTACNALARW